VSRISLSRSSMLSPALLANPVINGTNIIPPS